MTYPCVFQSEGSLRWLGEPDAVLCAQSLSQLHELRANIEYALANEYCFVAGILPYEVGSALHGLPCAPFTAWAYLYKDAPSQNTPNAALVSTPTGAENFALESVFKPEQTQQAYLASLSRIQAYLRAGDCYQVNLAQRFSTHFSGSTLSAWLGLQQAHPAPHSCYFQTDDGNSVFGVSPERFLSIRNRQVVAEPIKLSLIHI